MHHNGAAPVENLFKWKNSYQAAPVVNQVQKRSGWPAPLYQWLFESVKTKFLYLIKVLKFCIIFILIERNGT
jgi:hypothetical protein